MRAHKLVRLDADVEEKAFDSILEGKNLEGVAKVLGFKNVNQLQRYKAQHPEFMDLCNQAKLLECEILEERFKNALKNLSTEAAKVEMEICTRLLKWRDPKKYGEKQQIEMNVSVDILGALTRAQQRVIDVTPALVQLPVSE